MTAQQKIQMLESQVKQLKLALDNEKKISAHACQQVYRLTHKARLFKEQAIVLLKEAAYAAA